MNTIITRLKRCAELPTYDENVKTLFDAKKTLSQKKVACQELIVADPSFPEDILKLLRYLIDEGNDKVNYIPVKIDFFDTTTSIVLCPDFLRADYILDQGTSIAQELIETGRYIRTGHYDRQRLGLQWNTAYKPTREERAYAHSLQRRRLQSRPTV